MQKLVFMLILSLLTVFATHSNAASVYIATNSRTYHCDRNCPELNTDNVIEFGSPEEADALGAIPCGHCKLTTGKLNYNVKNVLPNPVITNGSLGEFRHGTFPSPPLGEYTHVGVDLVAPCGSDVYAFADGRVKDVIDNTNDKDYKTLGYMVLIEHPESLIGKKFYTLYLHMQGPPEVITGDLVTGGSTVIGKVGETGKAFGCHTHFEIRYFPERFSTWGNIYGPGDQRVSEYLKQNWENPIAFFNKYPNGLKLVKSGDTVNNLVKAENDNQEKKSIGSENTTHAEVVFDEGVYVEAEDFAKNYGLKFKEGIGFYVAIDGVPYPLGWTKDTDKQATESDIVQIPFDAQFYSYGLDFSTGTAPHILGYGLSYLDMNGQRHGRWAARFVPVAGYDQKVYRIIFEGPYEQLRNDKLQYHFWALEVPGREGFLFHFATTKFAEEQKKLRAFITQALSAKDTSYKGKLSARALIFDATVTPFHIRFTSFDEKTGNVEAEASGLNEKKKVKFTGQLVGIRQLTLKQVGGDIAWDLQLSEERKLTGAYSKDMSTFEVEIALEDAPTK